MLVCNLNYSSALKTEAIYSSEMWINFHQTEQRQIPECGILHSTDCENLRLDTSNYEVILCSIEWRQQGVEEWEKVNFLRFIFNLVSLFYKRNENHDLAFIIVCAFSHLKFVRRLMKSFGCVCVWVCVRACISQVFSFICCPCRIEEKQMISSS
jgi:hypothetical protein